MARTSTKITSRLGVESLEGRAMPAYISGGHLIISGTDAADNVFVQPVSVGGVAHIRVNQNGSYQDFAVNRLASDGQIKFWGYGGDDTFDTIVSNRRVYAVGGEGNDTLHGGSQADTLFGEGGNDKLYGWSRQRRPDRRERERHPDGERGERPALGQSGNDNLQGRGRPRPVDGRFRERQPVRRYGERHALGRGGCRLPARRCRVGPVRQRRRRLDAASVGQRAGAHRDGLGRQDFRDDRHCTRASVAGGEHGGQSFGSGSTTGNTGAAGQAGVITIIEFDPDATSDPLNCLSGGFDPYATFGTMDAIGVGQVAVYVDNG